MSITLREKAFLVAIVDSNRRLATAIDGLQQRLLASKPREEYQGWKIEQDLERLREELEGIPAIAEVCGVLDPVRGFLCTLDLAHTGAHEARIASTGYVVARWMQQ